MDAINENLSKLQGCNFPLMIQDLSVEAPEPSVFIRNLNLSFKKQTGKFVDVSPEIFWAEDVISVPLAVKSESLLGGPFTLEIALPFLLDDLDGSIKQVVLDSLRKFNDLSLSTTERSEHKKA